MSGFDGTHDAKIEKPQVDSRGVSDPVNVGTDSGLILVAWWDAKNECWWNVENNKIKPEYFGNVLWWSSIRIKTGWNYDESVYGGEA